MRRRLLYWSAVALAIAAVAGGALVAYRAYRDTTSATGAVRAYFAALQDGDAPAALGLGDVPPGSPQLVTSPVLRAQQAIAPIRQVHIGGSRTDGDSGQVHVDYVIGFRGDPQQIDDNVPVVRRGGRWRLAHSAVRTSLEMTSAKDRADILGRAVPEGDVLVFPGALPVHFDTPYLQLVPGEDYITFATGDQRSVAVGVSPSGRKLALAAVAAALRSCLTAPHPDPRCPLPDETYVPGSIRATPPPGFEKDLDISVQSDPGGLLSVTGEVDVQASYRRLTFANVARPGHGRVTLAVAAQGYAVTPLRIVWTQP